MTLHQFETPVTRACADVGRRVLSALPTADDDESRQSLAAVAWYEFLLATFEEPNARAWFREDTGFDLDMPRSPIARLIDSATGREREMFEQFIEWATERLWGLESAPKAYQDELAKRRGSEVTP